MSLLFVEGFDHYGTNSADLMRKWSGGTATPPAISTANGRRSGTALSMGNNVSRYVRKDVTASSTLIVGFAFRASALPTNAVGIAWFGDNGTVQTTLVLNPDGRLALYRSGPVASGTLIGTSANVVVTAGTYVYLEFKTIFAGGTGLAEVRANNNVVLTVSGATTTVSGNNSANQLYIGTDTAISGVVTVFWDDLYLLNDAGAVNQGYLGDCRVDVIYPTADGDYSQFTPSSGTVHNTLVKETGTPSSADYVSSFTVGQKDSYQMADLTLTGNVLGVQVNNFAFKDDVGNRFMSNLVRSGTTDATSTPQALTTSMLCYTSIQETDPATGALWTQAGINGLEVGTVVAS